MTSPQCIGAGTVEEAPGRAAPRSDAPGPQTSAQRRPWWRRVFGGWAKMSEGLGSNIVDAAMIAGSVVGMLVWIVGFFYVTHKTNAETPFSACCVTWVLALIVAVFVGLSLLSAEGWR